MQNLVSVKLDSGSISIHGRDQKLKAWRRFGSVTEMAIVRFPGTVSEPMPHCAFRLEPHGPG
jgi:hypothetical protein